MEADTGGTQPQVRESGHPQKLEEAGSSFSPPASGGNPALPAS